VGGYIPGHATLRGFQKGDVGLLGLFLRSDYVGLDGGHLLLHRRERSGLLRDYGRPELARLFPVYRLLPVLHLLPARVDGVVLPPFLFEEFVVGALKEPYAVPVKDYEAGGERGEDHLAVSHYDGRPVKGVYRLYERVYRFHVEVVCRLVKQEQVDRTQKELAQKDPAPLSAGEDRYLLERAVALEHHRAACPAGRAPGVVDVRLHQLLLDGVLQIEPLYVGLPEVTGLERRVPPYLSRVRIELPGQQVQKRGLALAVLSDDGYAVSLADQEREVVYKRLFRVVAEAHALHLDHGLAGEARALELEVKLPYLVELVEALLFVEGLYLRLHGAGLCGRGPEAVYELLDLLALLLVVRPRLLVYLLFLEYLRVELRGRPRDLPELGAVYGHGVRGYAVHEVAVVGDDYHLPLPCLEELAEPAHRKYVEVVGRLVKEKQVRLGGKELGEVEPYLVAAGELVRVHVELLLGDAEPHEYRLGPVGEVYPVLAKRQAEARLLYHRIFREVYMLGEVPCGVVLGHGYLARVRLLLAEYQLEKSSLAGPVPTHQPYPLAGRDSEVHIIEEHLPSVRLA